MSTSSLRLLGAAGPAARHYRFGPYELDVRAGELRKHGTRLRLRKQAFQILLILVEHPGEVVLREEILQKLWPDNIVVEFDHGINVAIQRLRDALGDSADDPQYVETLTGRGYRFLAPVEVIMLASRHETPAPLVPVPSQSEERPSFTSRTAVRVAVLTFVCLLAFAGWWRPWKVRQHVLNFTLPLGLIGNPIISPDGTAVVYRKGDGLAFRRLDSLDEIALVNIGRITDEPVWSPDGSQMAVQTLEGLVRLPVPGGATTVISAYIGPTRGLSWSPNGEILFAVYNKTISGLYLVSAAGGTPSRVDFPELKDGTFYEPQFLAGGGEILFAWVAKDESQANLYLASLGNGKALGAPRLVRRNATAGRFSPTGGGMLLYVQDDTLYAQRLDVRTGELEGKPQRMIAPVFSRLSMRRAQFSVSGNGVLAWRAGKTALSQITWFDRHGEVIGTAGPPVDAARISLSRDDRHVLIQAFSKPDMGIIESHQSGYLDLNGITQALWLPDGSRIVFTRAAAPERILQRPVGGGPEKEVLRIQGNTGVRLIDISADGKVLLFHRGVGAVYAAFLEDPSRSSPQPVIPAEEEVRNAHFSPDGRWIVYCAVGTKPEVYVVPFPERGLRTQISTTGGCDPLWRGDGKEILYRNGPRIYSTGITAKDGLIDARLPEFLFEVRVPDGLVGDSEPLALSHDGAAILFAQSADPADPKTTYLMTAWESLLRH